MNTRLILVAFALSCGGSTAVSDDSDSASLGGSLGTPPVRLVYAQGMNRGCSSCQGMRVVVEVANLGYNKDVALFHKTGSGWTEQRFDYLRSSTAQTDMFLGEFYGWDFEFVIRYRVGGKEYWDNNGGRNYRLKVDLGDEQASVLLGADRDLVVSESANCSELNKVCVKALVRNRAFSKKVDFVYSNDKWATTKVAAAAYTARPYRYGVEEWEAQLDAPDAASLTFAANVSMANTQSWDSASNQNFKCTQFSSPFSSGWQCTGGAIRDPRFSLPQP